MTTQDAPLACARYFGSDGTLCATHNGRFLSDTTMRCDRSTPEPVVTPEPHVHEYAPNGLVREKAIARSPVSVGDHTLYEKVFSVGLCPCGDVTRTHVANENVRTQAEEWQREAARR